MLLLQTFFFLMQLCPSCFKVQQLQTPKVWTRATFRETLVSASKGRRVCVSLGSEDLFSIECRRFKSCKKVPSSGNYFNIEKYINTTECFLLSIAACILFSICNWSLRVLMCFQFGCFSPWSSLTEQNKTATFGILSSLDAIPSLQDYLFYSSIMNLLLWLSSCLLVSLKRADESEVFTFHVFWAVTP